MVITLTPRGHYAEKRPGGTLFLIEVDAWTRVNVDRARRVVRAEGRER